MKTPEYRIWLAMKTRCYNQKRVDYPRYGARGITVCDEWLHSFEQFSKDMGPRPSPSHSLDRINNNVGYSKVNCRWATRKEQSNNMRSNRSLTDNLGVTKNIAEWTAIKGFSNATIRLRLDRGWSAHDAIHAPKKVNGVF